MNHQLLIVLLLFALLQVACDEDEAVELDGGALSWMEANTRRYLDDRSWRRDVLEQSLWRPELPYAAKLLDNYGLERGGWDLLPARSFEVAPVYGPLAPEEEFSPTLIDPTEPADRSGWLELGREVFWRLPMRRDAYLEWLVENPQVWDEVGLERGRDGALRGFVRYVDTRGAVRVGISCAACHGHDGEAGRAISGLDLGKARALYRRSRGIEPGPFELWGPGVVDVTDDGITDPVAIPNLLGLSKQRYYNASASIEAVNPATAALRFETQYILNYGYEVRPERTLTWALAMYVMSLDELDERGRGEPVPDVFIQQCASCHDPEASFSGGLVSAEMMSSAQLAASSPTRGTGNYRAPSLRGVGLGGPFLHDSSASTLEELLDSGHPFGASISGQERDALLAYLRQL